MTERDGRSESQWSAPKDGLFPGEAEFRAWIKDVEHRRNEGERPYTSQAAADYLGITTGHLYRLVREGKLESSRDSNGSRLSFTQKFLNEYRARKKRLRVGLGMPGIVEAISDGDLVRLAQIVEKDPRCAYTADGDDRTPLHYAVVYGNMHLVRYLIQHGADANARDAEGLQPIHKACEFAQFDAVRVLLDSGTQVDSLVTDSGYTPLYYSARNGNLAVIKLLIDRGAAVNAADAEDTSPLYGAIEGGQPDAARLLIENGADVNVENDYTTVLCYAVETGNVELVKVIVEGGANVNARDFDGESPLDWAEDLGDTSIAAYLREQGARD